MICGSAGGLSEFFANSVWLAVVFAASATMSNVVLYQPDAVMNERMGDVRPFALFIQKLEVVCNGSLTTMECEGLDVVVVLKPGGQSRVWFVSSLSKAPDRSRLKVAIEKIEVPAVSGPVAFALAYDLNGYAHLMPAGGKFRPPIPAEWLAKTRGKGPLLIPDGFIPYVWPDSH